MIITHKLQHSNSNSSEVINPTKLFSINVILVSLVKNYFFDF